MKRISKTLALMMFFTLNVWGAEAELKVTFQSLPRQSLTTAKIEKFSDLKGKVVLVDFWAAWCEPCKEALPHYNKLYQKYKNHGVVFIGINEDDDLRLRDTFLKANSPDFPMYADSSQQMIKDFKVQAIPSLFVFDRKQKAVALYRGYSPEKIRALEKKIQELLKQ